MLVYKYTRLIYLAYLLFLGASVVAYGILLLVVLSFTAEKFAVMVLILIAWIFLNLYLLLSIIKTQLIISPDSLIVMGILGSNEIPFKRVLAYKSYKVDSTSVFWWNAFRYWVFPAYGSQQWVEIHYKDFSGKKRKVKFEITNFANNKELLRNLDHSLSVSK